MTEDTAPLPVFTAPPETAEHFVASVADASRLPAFVQNVRSISRVATNLQVRVQMLEQEILNDPALTSRILRIAGSVGQRAKITSVKQAIILLGYERVTNLALSAAVFDKLERTASEVQDLLALSVLTANHGLCLAIEVHHGRPEMAYLCGLFSNLGELLTACYRRTKYLEWAATRTPSSPRPDGSEAAHFGFTFDDVAVSLARQWGLPTELVQSMRPQPLDVSAPNDRLLYIAQFSGELTRTAFASMASEVDDEDIEALMARYAKPLPMDRKTVDRAMAEARRAAAPAFRQMQLTLDGWRRARVLGGLDATAAPDAPPAAVDEESTEPGPEVTATMSLQKRPPARPPVRPLASMTLAETVDKVLTAGMSAGYARGVLALSDEAFTTVRARLGTGSGHDQLLADFVIDTTAPNTPFATALADGLDVFVDTEDSTDLDAMLYRGEPLVQRVGARSVSLLPLLLAGRLIGCLYFDHTQPVRTSVASRRFITGARDLLLAAFARQRAPSLSA